MARSARTCQSLLVARIFRSAVCDAGAVRERPGRAADLNVCATNLVLSLIPDLWPLAADPWFFTFAWLAVRSPLVVCGARAGEDAALPNRRATGAQRAPLPGCCFAPAGPFE